MKNIFFSLLLVIIPSSVTMAQYQNVPEKAPLVNVPLEKFVSQQKTLFNFNWKFQLVTEKNKNTDFASPSPMRKIRVSFESDIVVKSGSDRSSPFFWCPVITRKLVATPRCVTGIPA